MDNGASAVLREFSHLLSVAYTSFRNIVNKINDN